MPKVGDYEIYGCPHCGYYRISEVNQQLIDNGVVDPKAAQMHQLKVATGGYGRNSIAAIAADAPL